MFLGEDLPAWLLLALGAAMAAGNLAALLRRPRRLPARPSQQRESEGLDRPPLIRSLVFIAAGVAAALWALATLVAR